MVYWTVRFICVVVFALVGSVIFGEIESVGTLVFCLIGLGVSVFVNDAIEKEKKKK